MTAKAILLTNEDPDAYHKLAAGYYEKFQPADDVERDLVDEMVIAKWRQRRDWSNEAALFDLEMDHQTKKVDSQYQKIDHACRYALAFRALADESKSIQLLTRYEAAHQRSYYRALATLLKLREHTGPEPTPGPGPEPDEICETNPSGTPPPPDTAAPAPDAPSCNLQNEPRSPVFSTTLPKLAPHCVAANRLATASRRPPGQHRPKLLAARARGIA